ncbi:hypothetical protein [Consotaella aegiceratis]|uniref:hypothetical protein n=1 Tax=Consotaella aegiceratis TaxID=3097961 RepID=UPI002F4246B7
MIPLAQPVIAELADAKDRRADWRVNYPQVVLDEKNRRPFEGDWYRKVYGVIRSVAATGKHPKTKDANAVLRDVDLFKALDGFEPVPTVADLRDQDFRDTAVTWLSAAHCNKFEIAAITGHSLKSIDNVLRHYLGPDPELAREAMAKLEAWFKGKAR